MCIAIVKKAGAVLTKEVLFNCYTNNSDGCGFAYINEDIYGRKKIRIKKSMKFETFYDKYSRAVEQNPDSTFLIHFRIATHGTVDEYNCHPFQINDEQVFIHNGIIPQMGSEGPMDQRSDTRIFKDRILRKLPRGWESNPAIKFMIESIIGYSKLAVLNIDNTFNIFKENSGHWKNDVWYSNTSYLPVTYTRTTYNESYWNTKYNGHNYTRTKKQDRVEKVTNMFGMGRGQWVECEWCSEYVQTEKAKKVGMDGMEVVCCDECAALLGKETLFNTTHATPLLT